MKNLLLLHGALASKHQFDELIPLLSQQFAVNAINFSGHGGLSIPMYGYTFQTFANDILSYADQHRLEKLDLFGYSMGGYAALYFAKLHPQRVNRIFTLNVKFEWDPTTTAKETALLDAEKMVQKVPGYANQLMMLHGMNVWKDVLSQTANMMQQLTKDFLLVEEDYSKMNFPVRLAIGDRDKTSSVEETLKVYKQLPQSELWVLPNTAHPFEKLNKNELANALVSFFGHK
jgi:pimeloyl-ACP methyl ester carboxylesterase